MEITKQQMDDVEELKVKGRLDAYWADHLATAIKEAVRAGANRIRLNLSEVAYLSSAGIRVLLQSYKELKGIQGSFVVCNPSEPVKTVLDLAGFGSLLISGDSESVITTTAKEADVRQFERQNATFEVFECERGASLKCRAIGKPELLLDCSYGKEHSHTMSLSGSIFALGLGAIGDDFEDCRGRFGEFLAVAGAVIYLPTDGTNVPDYLLASGTFVPKINALYSLACEGNFAEWVRFEAKKETGVTVTLTEIVDVSLDIAGSESAGIVMIAETAGLMGASLTQSPALQKSLLPPFDYPEIQGWLSFTAERAYTRCLALIVGVASRSEKQALAPMIRPLAKELWPKGHFHAAIFPYRPLKKGNTDLKSTVSTLFEAESVQAVLHLINDDREIVGSGQSEFIRGACWIGPISEISVERN